MGSAVWFAGNGAWASRGRAARLAVVVVAGAVAFFAGSAPAEAARQTCPNTFHVLHNDHIGKLQLREGHYTITLRTGNTLTCAKASNLFTQFLEDWNGDLPRPWRLSPARSQQFRRDATNVGFGVKRGSKSGHGGKHPSGRGERCPGTFRVEHNDQIGKLKLPKGNYRITRLSNRKPTCAKASTLFARFLQLPSGNLPGHWRLTAYNATFERRHSGDGFRVKRGG